MARTNNLTNFLNDVASAIKQKTGDSTPIPASEFDTEIASIETAGNYQEKSLTLSQNGNYVLNPDTGYDAMSKVTIGINVDTGGIDTSDATATSLDILSPKTAYINGVKVYGALETTYDIISNSMSYSQVSNSNQIRIHDISDEFNLTISYNFNGTDDVKIYKWENNVLGVLLSSIPMADINSNFTSIQDCKFSRGEIESGYCAMYVIGNTTTYASLTAVKINVNTGQLAGIYYTYDISNGFIGGYVTKQGYYTIAPNPVKPSICLIGIVGQNASLSSYYGISLQCVAYNVSTNSFNKWITSMSRWC